MLPWGAQLVSGFLGKGDEGAFGTFKEQKEPKSVSSGAALLSLNLGAIIYYL